MAETQTVLPSVTLFQRSHARMVALQRLDEQLVTILKQRQSVQAELKQLQSQINEEFERMTKMDDDAPSRIISTIHEINAQARTAQPGSDAAPRRPAANGDPD